MKCLNCGQLERLHGDPNLPAGDTKVCDDFEPDHEAQAERLEWERERDIESRIERERERVHGWEQYPKEIS